MVTLEDQDSHSPSDSPLDQQDLEESIQMQGLENRGNTCFMNATVQCLVRLVNLATHVLLDASHATSDKHDCTNNERLCNKCYLQSLFQIPFGSQSNPFGLLQRFHDVFAKMRDGGHHDAHEFLMRLEQILVDHNFDSSDHGVFSGKFKYTIECLECFRVSEEQEEYYSDMVLHLDSSNSLEKALEAYLNEKSKAFCEHCERQVDKLKKRMLWILPEVFTFMPSRTKWDKDKKGGEKDNKQIQFPLEMDVYPFLLNKTGVEGELKYKLSSFIEHDGGSNFGHYWCFIQIEEREWYKFNDKEVTRVTEDDVLKSQPYILFYSEHKTEWFEEFYRMTRGSIVIFPVVPGGKHEKTREEQEAEFLKLKYESDDLRNDLVVRTEFLENALELDSKVSMEIMLESLQGLNKSMKLFLDNSKPMYDSLVWSSCLFELGKNQAFSPCQRKRLVRGVAKFTKNWPIVKEKKFPKALCSIKKFKDEWVCLVKIVMNRDEMMKENISAELAISILEAEIKEPAGKVDELKERLDDLKGVSRNEEECVLLKCCFFFLENEIES